MKFVSLFIILVSTTYSNFALARSYKEDQAYKQAIQQMQSQGRKIDEEINKGLTPEQRMAWCKEYKRKKQGIQSKKTAQPVADKKQVLAEMTDEKHYKKEQEELERKLKNNKNMSLYEQASLAISFQKKINVNTEKTMRTMMADPAKRKVIIPEEGHATIAGVEDYLNASNCEGVTAEGAGGDDFGYDED